MRKSVKALGIAAVLGGLVTLPPLYADETNHPPESGMGSGMMMDGGMMKMMRGMGGMMESCSSMMMNSGESASRPNDQWRKNAPGKLEQK